MNFIETIFQNLEKHGDKTLLVEMHGKAEEDTTNLQLRSWIESARGTLRERSVARGDRVVLLAPNSAKWVAADLGILAEGAIVVPMYARQSPAELSEMMHDCGAKLVVCADTDLAASVREHWSGAPIVTFEDFFSGEGVSAPPLPRDEEEIATIIYTSGTSGSAKGVMLSVKNIDFMLPVTRDALLRLMGTRPTDDRVFHYLPFCFAGSRIVLLTCLFRNNPIHMSTDLNNLKEEFTAAKPHYFLNVPALLERIKNGVEEKIFGQGRAVVALYTGAQRAYLRQSEGRARKRDGLLLALARAVIFKKIREGIGPNLECLICGSAPLGEETQRWFEMLGIPVYQVYGLTETTAIVTMDEPRAATPGRVGHVIPGCQVQLGEHGELLVRGPNIFAGYWNREEETGAAYEDGWFKTGDAAEADDSGNFRIIGRTKNVLVPSSGHNVAPEPIEQRLLEGITGVEHVVIFGHGRPYLTAVISGEADMLAVEHAVDELNNELPHYRRIRKFHLTCESFTPENGLLTANQKLKRRALESHFGAELKRMYS